MHARLLVIGDELEEISDAVETGLLNLDDMQPDSWLLSGFGMLKLRSGAQGRTLLDEAIEGGAPDILIEHARARLALPCVEHGVDSALKGDIANLHELLDLLGACLAVRGATVTFKREEIERWIADAPPDTRIAIRDLHY